MNVFITLGPLIIKRRKRKKKKTKTPVMSDSYSPKGHELCNLLKELLLHKLIHGYNAP